MKYNDSKCRAIGNASGFIIDKEALKKANIDLGKEVTVKATNKQITIKLKE